MADTGTVAPTAQCLTYQKTCLLQGYLGTAAIWQRTSYDERSGGDVTGKEGPMAKLVVITYIGWLHTMLTPFAR